MREWHLLGLNTLELIHVDNDYSDVFKSLPPELQLGPQIHTYYLGMKPGKSLFVYPEHLKLLYDRFTTANPKGVVMLRDDEEYNYAPPGLIEEEVLKLDEEGKIFVDLFISDAPDGYPYARKYLPEVFEPQMLAKMEADPWLDTDLLRKVREEGIVPGRPGWSRRWSPEWRAYCDRLAAGESQK